MAKIFVVSDGTGRTAEQALHAALTQFGDADVDIERCAEVRSPERVRGVVEAAAASEGLIVHTLVSDDLRGQILREARHHNVETIDLMGPLLARLGDQLLHSPAGKPGLFRELNADYFRRIESMEFAIQHDDGRRTEDLGKAEIVLVGVSRTFKTPLSIYLAFKKWYVANVPLVLGCEPPSILWELPRERVFGLKASPHFLASLRRTRHEYLRESTGDYSQLAFVQREMAFALRLFERGGWPSLDVTNKPIEEIASEILTIGKLRPQREASGTDLAT